MRRRRALPPVTLASSPCASLNSNAMCLTVSSGAFASDAAPPWRLRSRKQAVDQRVRSLCVQRQREHAVPRPARSTTHARRATRASTGWRRARCPARTDSGRPPVPDAQLLDRDEPKPSATSPTCALSPVRSSRARRRARAPASAGAKARRIPPPTTSGAATTSPFQPKLRIFKTRPSRFAATRARGNTEYASSGPKRKTAGRRPKNLRLARTCQRVTLD